MKHLTFIFLMTLTSIVTFSQNAIKSSPVSSLVVNTHFIDTLTFNLKWNYPWYIEVLENGGFGNALGDTLTEADTAHLYHTASAITNHQGEHEVKYCISKMDHDTLLLNFLPELPGYASWLSIKINNGKFWSNFKAAYPRYIKGETLIWTIKKQSLILNQSHYNVNDTIKGYFEIEFVETSLINGKITHEQTYYFKGYFKTPLKSNE